MDVRVPQVVTYETNTPVPLGDLIESLRGSQFLIQESAFMLESLVGDRLAVKLVSISVEEISQRSPLREVFWAYLATTYQPELDVEVPHFITQMTGVHVPDRYDGLVTFIFLLLLFYGAEFACRQVNRAAASIKLRSATDEFLDQVAKELGVSADAVRQKFRKSIKGKQQKI